MDTPIADFVSEYKYSGYIRLHIPGHKGKNILGCEALDITEIAGADSLFEANGIIRKSEQNATSLFGTRATCYSTEGSSCCIRAMLHLIKKHQKSKKPYILSARNAHKAFVYGLALCDIDVRWITPKSDDTLCSAAVCAQDIENYLARCETLPVAVYLTSPDYLGVMQPIEEIAKVCHKYGVLLAVDNAHGAYLHFLKEPIHPIDLGADICCDSAHKTLPVLTGGAYLHISKTAPKDLALGAKESLALFSSTSPSYLTLQSLDLCNKYLNEGFSKKLESTVAICEEAKALLRKNGWETVKSEPLKITLLTPQALSGEKLSDMLRTNKIEGEYANRDNLVFMVSTENTRDNIMRLVSVLGVNSYGKHRKRGLPSRVPVRKLSIREAIFSDSEMVKIENAVGRICAAPSVSCPPAIPIAVSGEVIDDDAVKTFLSYGIDSVSVVK